MTPNSIRLLFPLLFISCFYFQLKAQVVKRSHPVVEQNGRVELNAWTGGMTAVQFSEVDLNLDGALDLFVFDRIGNVILPFEKKLGSAGLFYDFSPQYRDLFPDIKYWVLLRDYNDDGIMDIFMYSSIPGVSGVEVHKGNVIAGQLQFEKIRFPNQNFDLLFYPLNSGGLTNLYVSIIDIPAIDDLDGDGDLDILTFNISGGKVEFFRNESVERGFGLDTLIYVKTEDCWGGIFESGVTPELQLATRPGDCAARITGVDDPVSPRHTGSTLLTFDLDDDCDKELVLGDLSFDHLVLARNGGNCNRAWVNSQDTFFPSYDVKADLPSFPAAFYLDVDHDGRKDFIATKNLENGGEDYKAVWFYKNIQSNQFPRFQLVQKDFLVDQMIDLGTGAYPAFADINADGLMDLVVGNESYYQRGGDKDSRLQLFENQGTPTNPKFVLVNENWLDLRRFTPAGGSSNGIWCFAPTFGDLDQDGDEDLFVGNSDGKLFYMENTGGAGNPAQFASPNQHFSGIDIGGFSAAAIGDINRDGLPDLLVGEQNGNVNYFQNIGTRGFPQFSSNTGTLPNLPDFGKIDLRENFGQTGFGTPVLMDFGNRVDLFIGNDEGALRLYKQAENGVTATLIPETNSFGGIFSGKRSSIALRDVDADGLLEMVVGNLRGGLEYFETNLSVEGEIVGANNFQTEAAIIKVFPNPAGKFVSVSLENFVAPVESVSIFDCLGNLKMEQKVENDKSEIDLSDFPKGIYFLLIKTKNQFFSKKLIKN